MPSSSSKHSSSPTSYNAKASKRIKSASTSMSNKSRKAKKRDRKAHTSDHAGASDSALSGISNSNSESEAEDEIAPKDLKSAGRTIAWCCDMFCDVNKAVDLVILSKQEDQANKGESDSEDEDSHRARKEALDRITPRMLGQYKKVYATLLHEVPIIKMFINDPSHASRLKAALKKVNEAISETRSNDSAWLQEKLAAYILQNPKVDTMKPLINASTAKSELGLNHIQLAGFLCPVESVMAYRFGAEETRKKLENSEIDMSATELPVFLWEDNGARYDEDDMYSGFFRGFYLERIARHIFTGPSTAHSGDSRGARSCNAVLHKMDKVKAMHISYAAVLARFGISSQTCWAEKDGRFNYHKFYYIVMDLIDECEDIQWKEDLLKHYNVLFFKNEEGRGADSITTFDAPTHTAKAGQFASRMQAQAVARAACITEPLAPVSRLTSPIPPAPTPAPAMPTPAMLVPAIPRSPKDSSAPAPGPSRWSPRPRTPPPALDPLSDLSDVEPEEVSARVAPKKKGRAKQSDNGGSKKRKSAWRKGKET